jgi:hypothetical protein
MIKSIKYEYDEHFYAHIIQIELFPSVVPPINRGGNRLYTICVVCDVHACEERSIYIITEIASDIQHQSAILKHDM